MRNSAAALELDFTEPSITAARAVANTIARSGTLKRDTLLWVMEQAYNTSSAPAPIAYLAALAARITAKDVVLEPSAGS